MLTRARLVRKIHQVKENNSFLMKLAIKYRKIKRLLIGKAILKHIYEDVLIFLKTPKDYIYLYTYSTNEKVEIKDFDKQVKMKGLKLKEKIEKISDELKVEFIGSTSLELPGQNDIDLVIPCNSENFSKYTPGLAKIFGAPRVKRNKFIHWTVIKQGISVDVLLIDPTDKRYKRQVKRYLMMKQNSELKDAYKKMKEDTKGKSMRVYEREKLKFFNLVLGP